MNNDPYVGYVYVAISLAFLVCYLAIFLAHVCSGIEKLVKYFRHRR